jgi:hypothetical protein
VRQLSEDGDRRARRGGADAAGAPSASPAYVPAVLGLQRQAGNAAVAGLVQRQGRSSPGLRHPVVRAPGRSVQREVTTRMTNPSTGQVVDISQLTNYEIRKLLKVLRKARAQAKGNPKSRDALDEQIAFATNYRQKRVQAGKEISRWTGDSRIPATSPRFTGVDKDEVAKHLQLTIQQPHLINQEDMAWCGPNDVLMVIARNDPEEYARYVMGLYATGSSRLGAMEVAAGAGVKSGVKPDSSTHDLAGADWMALGSLRDAGNWFLSATDEAHFGHATFPGDVKSWFGKYGVPGDKILQRGGFIARTDADDLLWANGLFNAGWNVLLWVHVWTLAGQGGTPEQIPLFDIAKTHWVVMDGTFAPNVPMIPPRWTCDAITWGEKGTHKVEVDPTRISSSVWGIVAVDMRAQARRPAA